MVRSKRVGLLIATAAALAVAGCAELLELNDILNEPMTPEMAAYWDAQRASQPYTPDYSTIGTPYDTGATGSPSGRASSSTGSSSPSQCTSGRPAPCVFPDGSTGTCCASPQ